MYKFHKRPITFLFYRAGLALCFTQPVLAQAQQSYDTMTKVTCLGQTLELINTQSNCPNFSESFDGIARDLNHKKGDITRSICSGQYGNLKFSPSQSSTFSTRVRMFNQDVENESRLQLSCDEQGAVQALQESVTDADYIEQLLKGMEQQQGRSAFGNAVMNFFNSAYILFAGAGDAPIPSQELDELVTDIGTNVGKEVIPDAVGGTPKYNPMVLMYLKNLGAP